MKTHITAWPIDRQFQERLGIYSSGYVSTSRVGEVLTSLVEEGYTEINSFVELSGDGTHQLTIHCQANVALQRRMREEDERRRKG